MSILVNQAKEWLVNKAFYMKKKRCVFGTLDQASIMSILTDEVKKWVRIQSFDEVKKWVRIQSFDEVKKWLREQSFLHEKKKIHL